MKYMDDNNIDIMCIQESKTPSNSFFKFGNYICVSSTDIQGGEQPTKTAGKKTTKANLDEAPGEPTKWKKPTSGMQ